MGHIISPEHSDRGFSAEIMQENATKVMCHDMDITKNRPCSPSQFREHPDNPTAPLWSSSSIKDHGENFRGDFTHESWNRHLTNATVTWKQGKLINLGKGKGKRREYY